jgi:hypothetical protein
MKTLITALALTAIAVLAAGYPSTASAQWLVNGIWVSNMCRAYSGNWFVYPPQNAQPVGTSCLIPPTGEYGVVTAN